MEQLTDPAFLRSVNPDVVDVRSAPVETRGFSGSTFFRLEVRTETARQKLLLKETRLDLDWFSHRSEDLSGREALVVSSSAHDAIWNVFHCPYWAVAIEDRRIGVLMEDLSNHLFPDERKPIDPRVEDLILDAMTRLHGEFWNHPKALAPDWLLGAEDYFTIMGPGDHSTQDRDAPPPDGIREALYSGWEAALELLPPATADLLLAPVSRLIEPWSELPLTLLHGDLKLANLALLPSARLSAFDWAFAGAAPATFDLGWYLAVNATRLTSSKEEFIERYRSRLETVLNGEVDRREWPRLVDAGIMCGAMMLLWTKGLAMKQQRSGAASEWRWWEAHLNRITASL